MAKRLESIEEDVTRRKALRLALGASAGAAAFVLGCGGSTAPRRRATTPAAARGAAAAAARAAGRARAVEGAPGAAVGRAAAERATTAARASRLPKGKIGPDFADDSDAASTAVASSRTLTARTSRPAFLSRLTILVVDSEKGVRAVRRKRRSTSGTATRRACTRTKRRRARTYRAVAPRRPDHRREREGQALLSHRDPPGRENSGRTTTSTCAFDPRTATPSTSDGSNTTEPSFDLRSSIGSRLASRRTAPKGRTRRRTASDHVYSGEQNGANLLSLTGDDTNGYAAVVAISVADRHGTTAARRAARPEEGDRGGAPPDGGP